MKIRIERALQAIVNRLSLIVNKCLYRTVDDSQSVQRLEASILRGEVKPAIESFAHFGFTSHPPKDTEGVLLSLGGSRSHTVVVATENRALRLKNLAEGDAAIYDKQGNYVWVKSSGEIEIKTSGEIKLSAPLVTMTGNCAIEGNLTVQGAVTAQGNVTSAAGDVADPTGTLGNLRSTYNSHTHTGSFTGNTSTPTPTA